MALGRNTHFNCFFGGFLIRHKHTNCKLLKTKHSVILLGLRRLDTAYADDTNEELRFIGTFRLLWSGE
jgi:hypothetical protein